MNCTEDFNQDSYFGVVLAAGYGSRLRPFTNSVPKPLIPFLGVPLLYMNINRLAKIGLKNIGVNAHYLSEQIVAAIADFPLSVNLTCSIEEVLLGTAGAYVPMDKIRKKKPILAVNGDIVTDFIFPRLIDKHEKLNAVASMGLLPRPHKNEVKIWVRDDRVVSIGEKPSDDLATPHGFACVQVFSDRFLSEIEHNESISIIDYYKRSLQLGEVIAADVQQCFWFDLGTWADYRLAHRSYLSMLSHDSTLMDRDTLGVFEFAKTHLGMTFDFVARDYTDSFNNKFIGPSLVDRTLQLAGNNTIGPFAVAVGKINLAESVRVRDSIVCNHDKISMSGDFENCLYYDGIQLPLE